MKYVGSANTDIGTSKERNQDSVCLKIGDVDSVGQIVMGIVCDGMGGLAKGELASATVIRAFNNWFNTELPKKIKSLSFEDVSRDWDKIIKEQNYKIMNYGKKIGIRLGTTVSAILIVDNKYIIVHIGDSRIYKLDNGIKQLTEDHTFVNREIKNNNMTEMEAKVDSRKNILLQCVGASTVVLPDIVYGEVNSGDVYLLCSDGLCHEVDKERIFQKLNYSSVRTTSLMDSMSIELIDEVKAKGEKDNISVVLIKCDN